MINYMAKFFLNLFERMAPLRQSGLGAVLPQRYDDQQPITFASRSMTDAETHYAQIEKEL